MRQIKIAAGGLVVSSCFITLFLYYWYHSSTPSTRYQMHSKIQKHESTTKHVLRITNIPMRHVPLNEVYKDEVDKEDSSFDLEERKPMYMINTPGCQIPAASIEYNKYVRKKPLSCGKRTVFLRKIEDDTVRVTIKPRAMKQYLRRSKNFSCCARFMKKPSHAHENHKLEYTSCKKIHDGETFKLETDFINIKCFEYDTRNVTHIIYNDIYPFIKKIDSQNINQTNSKPKYNILMMGMDSMSLFRVNENMPRTINFFVDNFWFGFRGYHKVGDNTFPNLMAALTGKNLSSIIERCSGKMDECNDLLLWSKFKENGYATAYGEDYLRLPDTFNKKFAFKKPPTDHYLRTFFLHGEVELHNQSLVCAGKQPSGQHLLDYAVDFATTYRESAFFGMFWMNSFSHNVNSHPQDADKMFENFFNQLSYTGVLENTFVIFFSDHGIRFGEYRLQLESYYEERMPALLMWIPERFRGLQPKHYQVATENQVMLLTPYDLYNTLIFISSVSNGVNYTEEEYSESCPKCGHIFEVIQGNRTCKDVGISEKWCSCHTLYPLDIHDTEGMKSVLYVVSHIKSMVKTVKTERCWGCMSLALKTIIRIHFYYSQLSLFYVVAFSMTPGNVSYEATVARRSGKMELVGGVSVISVYRGLGKCTIQQRDRLFCVCQRKENC